MLSTAALTSALSWGGERFGFSELVGAPTFADVVRHRPPTGAVDEDAAHLGVPAVSAGRGSLYETDEAQQLLALLLALSTPGDERRLRAVLATPMLKPPMM